MFRSTLHMYPRRIGDRFSQQIKEASFLHALRLGVVPKWERTRRNHRGLKNNSF
jgi:hypothetical protein